MRDRQNLFLYMACKKQYEKKSRKEKKAYLGFKLSKNKIRKLLNISTLIESTSRDDTDVYPVPFCPACGCSAVHWFNHGAAYPERWVTGVCARCDQKVWESDNSPYIHILEWILGEDNLTIKEACREF